VVSSQAGLVADLSSNCSVMDFIASSARSVTKKSHAAPHYHAGETEIVTRMPFCSCSTLFVSGFMMRDVESILARFSEVMEQMTCIRAVFEKVPAP